MNTTPTYLRRLAGVVLPALLITLLLATACAPPSETAENATPEATAAAEAAPPQEAQVMAAKAMAAFETEEIESLTFAETWEFWTAPTLLADILGLYRKVGLDVRVAKFPTGLAAKNAVLTHSTDLGLVADTPMALAGFRKEDIRLIATYFQSDSIVKLVAANGGGEPTREDLLTKTVGYVPGTISEQVLERIIDDYGLKREEVRRASFRPTDMVDAIATGAIGAFVGWEPLPIYARRTLGEDHVSILADEDFYTVSLHLVTRPEVIERKRGALVKFVRALDLARQEIASDPEGTRRRVEEALGFEAGELAPFWNPSQFEIKLEAPALVDNLKREAEWLVKAGYATGDMPTYESLIDSTIYDEFRSGNTE